jgi:hypothetical protein
VQGLAAKDGFQLVSTQIDQVGATDVTPQVPAMLAAMAIIKPDGTASLYTQGS